MGWYNSRAQHNIVAAGRRSFKTERAKRKLVIGTPHHPGALTMDNARFFFGGPTHQQAKRIAWNDLKTMTLPYHKGTPSESELVIRLDNRSEIHVVGLDKPERIEGVLWHGGNLDEIASMKAQTWPAHVQPVTADTGAWVDFTGVPEGKSNHLFVLKEDTRDLPDFAFWTWKSADVLPPHVIAKAMATLDERTYRQEYEASFESAGGVVYGSFDDESIITRPFMPNAPTVLTWDFNRTDVKPMVCLVVQSINGHPIKERNVDATYCLTKEFVYTNTGTEEMSRAVLKFLQESGFNAPLYVSGDFSGNRRESNASSSDYAIIADILGNVPGYYKRNPVTRKTEKIENRVAALNSLFRAIDGTRRLFVDRSCTNTIEDLRRTEWAPSRAGLNADGGQRTDETDALSYFAYNYHDVSDKKPTVRRRG